ncbi:hypothetical protein DXG01_015329, partial [Tephrocybe rancida]
FKEQLATSEAAIQDAEDTRHASETGFKELQAELSNLEQGQATKDQELRLTHNQCKSLGIDNTVLRSQVNQLNIEISRLNNELLSKQDALLQAQTGLEEKERALKTVAKKYHEATNELNMKTTKMTRLTSALVMTTAEKEKLE